MYLHFSTGNGQPSELALCQLYRRTFVPYIHLYKAAGGMAGGNEGYDSFACHVQVE